ncbi:isovaleryl-CoA dehydrogenase, mitochondrial [Hyalella azteca]|uniref:Isovaleryl-CoA dehydrogenase, mitochondrial n=1 Tax=Hyalella azteca TaxID=294128 RepID=A0A8B7P0Y9_HYAAZ|nr:isovaleryl-CoA dehydrogenase, mitochondrial [Hyalella azteca]
MHLSKPVVLMQRWRFSYRCMASLASHYPINDTFYGLSEVQQQLRKTVFDFAQKEIAPRAAQIDKTDDFPEMRELWLKMGSLGLLGATADADFGGSGMGYFEHAIICEEIGRASGSVGLSYGAHANLCVNQINRSASEDQKRRYLPKLCSGEHVGAMAMSEAGSGSDALSMKLSAVLDGNSYVLNGTKYWITNGPHADVLLVYAKTEQAHKQGLSAFIVERNSPGFSSGHKLDKLGMRGSGTSELVFNDCRVSAENVVGGVNRGAAVLFSGLDLERLMIAAGALGIMQAACDVAFDYVHSRKQFGRPVGEFQLMQGKIADMYTKLNACRSYVYTAARAADDSGVSSKDCASVVLFVAECTTQVALQAIQCLGGNGYVNDYPTGRLLRDAKLFEIGAGTSEIRRLVVGRALNAEYKD